MIAPVTVAEVGKMCREAAASPPQHHLDKRFPSLTEADARSLLGLASIVIEELPYAQRHRLLEGFDWPARLKDILAIK